MSLTVLSLRAGHIMGGDMYYDCVNDSQFVVTLTLFRDCDPGPNAANYFDAFMPLSIYDAGADTLIDVVYLGQYGSEKYIPINSSLKCFADTPYVCIKKQVYRETFTINVPVGGVHLVTQRCCRSPNAINVAPPANQYGNTYYSFIPDTVVADSNSSPRFNAELPKFLCVDAFQDLDFSASDPDGDSLRYEFSLPYHGGSQNNPTPNVPTAPPFQTVPPAGGFSKNYQIDAFPAFELDSATGIATGKPISIGKYILTVSVLEYRDSVFIGETRRDFLIATTICDIEAAAAIDSALEECIGFDIAYKNHSTIGKSFHWDFGDPSTTSDTDTISNPTYTYPDTGVYTVRLIAKGNGDCADTTYLDYRVQHKIEPFFTPPETDCFDVHKYDFRPKGFSRDTTSVTWYMDTIDSVKFRNPKTLKDYKFPGAGDYLVTLKYEDFGCVRTYTDTVSIWPNPDFKIKQKPITQCAPFDAEMSIRTSNAYKPRFFWMLDTTIISEADTARLIHPDPGKHSITIWMYTDSHCIDTIVHHYPDYVIAIDTPVADFVMQEQAVSMWEPEFFVSDASRRSASVEYYLEEEWLSSQRNERFEVRTDTGNFRLTQVAYHQNGCIDSTEQIIRVEPDYLTYVPNSFSPNGDGINDGWRASVYTHTKYQVRIFDRWGKTVFTSDDPYYEWNGRLYNGGDPCPIGAYTYEIQVEDNMHREWWYYGHLTLIR